MYIQANFEPPSPEELETHIFEHINRIRYGLLEADDHDALEHETFAVVGSIGGPVEKVVNELAQRMYRQALAGSIVGFRLAEQVAQLEGIEVGEVLDRVLLSLNQDKG